MSASRPEAPVRPSAGGERLRRLNHRALILTPKIVASKLGERALTAPFGASRVGGTPPSPLRGSMGGAAKASSRGGGGLRS
jgi:hypothetical protein